MIRKIFLFAVLFVLFACRQETGSAVPAKVVVTVPVFSADSAYQYIADQVAFGPRVPNTDPHRACAEYLVSSLQRTGAVVTEQKADLRAFDGTVLKATNIIGSFQPELKSRILLFAHWDTRPWSDHDPDPANFNVPVTGANDGASGVGVLLEVARQLGKQAPTMGVDILFFDAEDYGAHARFSGVDNHSWCLGSQHWSRNPHVKGYRARFGILLDMVGAPNATFYREQISEYYAPEIVRKVWTTAQSLGFERYFVNQTGGSITDDHLYVNRIAGIPSVNIIQYDPRSAKGFGEYWHTVNDDMRYIDKNTLMAVGTTVLQVVYQEQ